MAVYGLSAPDEQSLLDTKIEDIQKTKITLGVSLLNILTTKVDYSLYEATSYLKNPQTPPPFRVISVSKDYTLPQRLATHSNLSPLNSDSPTFPDGLISTLWIKKHLYYPSVVVGFYELYTVGEKSKRETGPLASQILIDPAERENDANLTTEINSRRKYFQDKGIKFSAVVMLKQKHADVSIEERLSSIKKQCGLDYKNSFFVVAPSSTDELQDFVKNLCRVLYEPAMLFYSNRIKKIRKKKSKVSSPAVPKTDLSSVEPLSAAGWLCRYDIKAGYFQECKQEIESALKTYESAYHSITSILSPNASHGHVPMAVNSKRWNETRVLADCLNIKICRFYLYSNEPAIALSQLNNHLHIFQSYSPSWGIGEQTHEYWACLSKQYQLFADMIDVAVLAGYKIPLPTEYLITNSPSAGQISNTVGCNPGAILQHPGFYYHLAAMCCAERRRRFLEHERSTGDQHLEKVVDHAGLTIELLTKSYEQFKRYRNSRMTLYLAAEIAGMYYETGKYDMAIKFFERIGKTYRKENWNMVLTSILRWSLRCAKELKSWEKAIECLVELLSDELPMTEVKRMDVQKELTEILDNQVDRAPLLLHMNQITSFLKCHVQIKNSTSFVGSRVEYQVKVKTNKNSPVAPLRFGSMRIFFNNSQYNVILRDSNDNTEPNSVELIDFSNDLVRLDEDEKYSGWLSAQCDLRVIKGQLKVFQGIVVPQECSELEIIGFSFDLPFQWQVELNFTIDQMTENQHMGRHKWLESISETTGKPVFGALRRTNDFSKTNVLKKPPSIDISFSHNAPALLDELFELKITVKNTEEETIHAKLYAEMKNPEGVEGEISTIEEKSLGSIEKGQLITTPAYLHGSNISGSRIVHLTVKYTVNTQDTSEIVEKTEHIRIPFIAPFDTAYELSSLTERLEKSNEICLAKSEKWLLTVSLQCLSVWDLEIKNIRLNQNKYSKVLFVAWRTGHAYNTSYLFQLDTADLTEAQPSVPTGSLVVTWKRFDKDGDYYKSVVSLPDIKLQQQSLVLVADIPSEIYLEEPFTLSYTIYNPTEQLIEYTGSIELSDAFIFSGYKQVKSTILPLSRKVYHYVCYPIISGKVRLPKLKIAGPSEVPVEIVGAGPMLTLNADFEAKQPKPLDTAQHILTFVHPKRKLQ
ncbi:Gryzun, putative trafficking through golgi-domain-containing protein [Sporodiniella umbellata]|nr:Gryzun, putative trafficking through golgi-domain-containing protein [Sporodiniella umbellata]